MIINRKQFESLNCKLIKSEKTGSGIIGTNTIDTYETDDGKIIVHEWANGGESFSEIKDEK